MERVERLEARCHALSSEGAGVCRREDGMTAFVPGALPGEFVRARIVKKEKRYVRAALEAVLEPSPHRQEPRCPDFRACGGCVAQHMDYASQLEWKQQRLHDALARIGGVSFGEGGAQLRASVGMETPWQYRNKAVYAISEKGDVGFYRPGTHSVVDIGECFLQDAASNAVASAVRRWLRQGNPARVHGLLVRIGAGGDVLAALHARDAYTERCAGLIEAIRAATPGVCGVLWGVALPADAPEAYETLYGEARFRDALSGVEFDLHARSFFQVNRGQAERLFAIAAEAVGKAEIVVDAYCGAGALTLLLARAARFVLGVEILPEAIVDAWENARRNGIENVEFVCAAAEEEIPARVRRGLRPEVVTLDPPRAGCDAALLRAVEESGAGKIVYISCDPGTLARDVQRLRDTYRVDWAQAVDMFPWTAHGEAVCQLSRIV